MEKQMENTLDRYLIVTALVVFPVRQLVPILKLQYFGGMRHWFCNAKMQVIPYPLKNPICEGNYATALLRKQFKKIPCGIFRELNHVCTCNYFQRDARV